MTNLWTSAFGADLTREGKRRASAVTADSGPPANSRWAFSLITIHAADACRLPIRMSLLCQIDMTLPRIFREVPGVTVRLMSDKELARFEVLRDLAQRRLTPAAAAQLLGLERRQVFRLLKVYCTEGAAGLISKRRGRPSNRRQPAELRATALAIIRERYWDFGPTLAVEKLGELHGIALGRETLRQWMMADGLWVDRKQRLKRVHQPRSRRECVGELVQIDGCEHWWFEDRGPQCTLLVFIDDATSRLMHLQFVESESTFAYFQATRAYVEAWGKPVAFYSDKHGVFRVNHPGALGGDGMTQFGRALHALNIDIICANSSQAKGRVERAQDDPFHLPTGRGERRRGAGH